MPRLCRAMLYWIWLCHAMLYHAMSFRICLCCAMPCHAVLRNTVLGCAMPGHAWLCHAMLCHTIRSPTTLCHATPRGARVLLTRLGGWCGAEHVATSRSHWRVSSSQHPSGDPRDRDHISACRCSPGHCGQPMPHTCRQVGDGGCLRVHQQQVL